MQSSLNVNIVGWSHIPVQGNHTQIRSGLWTSKVQDSLITKSHPMGLVYFLP